MFSLIYSQKQDMPASPPISFGAKGIQPLVAIMQRLGANRPAALAEIAETYACSQQEAARMIPLEQPSTKELVSLFEHADGAKVETIHTLFQASTLQECLDEMDRVGVARPAVAEPARTISKLAVRRQLRAWGKESAFEAMLDGFPNVRNDWNDAVELKTDDPLFSTHREAFKAALGLSEEQFTTIMQLA